MNTSPDSILNSHVPEKVISHRKFNVAARKHNSCKYGGWHLGRYDIERAFRALCKKGGS